MKIEVRNLQPGYVIETDTGSATIKSVTRNRLFEGDLYDVAYVDTLGETGTVTGGGGDKVKKVSPVDLEREE